jgi:hypothetical protein
MAPRRYDCVRCGASLTGSFEGCRFCRLDGELLRIFEAFVRARGNLREVQREIGISYPTLSSRLDAILRVLGWERLTPPPPPLSAEERRAVLDRLERGEISALDAETLLRGRER